MDSATPDEHAFMYHQSSVAAAKSEDAQARAVLAGRIENLELAMTQLLQLLEENGISYVGR